MAAHTEELVEDDDEQPMTLKVAICIVSSRAIGCHDADDFEEATRLVVAAAQAFACKMCDGKGKVLVAVVDTYVDCARCKESRLILKGR